MNKVLQVRVHRATLKLLTLFIWYYFSTKRTPPIEYVRRGIVSEVGVSNSSSEGAEG